MSGKAITRLFVLCFLVLGLVTLGVAGSKKQGNDKGTGADAQAGQSSGNQQKGKNVTPAEKHEPVDPSQYVGAETCKTCHEEQAALEDRAEQAAWG
jgi:hypothetical protein